MENEQPDESNNDTSSTEADWESRTLCSDGNCIGVIGPDGHCKECGLAYDGEAPAIEGQVFEADDYDDDDDGDDGDDETGVASEASDDSDWENRQLCSDGNCIGVIGPNGRCKECGKRFKG
jgi:hypothetical protein